MRRHARIEDRKQIMLRVPGRNELRAIWMRDISKGGLFLEIAPPPELRSAIMVRIETPEGVVDLEGEVVHVSDAGAGVQFTNLDAERRQLIEAYVEGLSARLAAAVDVSGLDTGDVKDLQATVRRFLKGCEADELYDAIGCAPADETQDVVARLDTLIEQLASVPEKAPPSLKTRSEHAASLATRVRRLMANSSARQHHDLRHGFVELHLRRAEMKPDLRTPLRKLWNDLHPQKVGEAALHAKKALQLLSITDVEGAVGAAEEALELDPFNFELRLASRDWKRRLDLRRENGGQPQGSGRSPTQ